MYKNGRNIKRSFFKNIELEKENKIYIEQLKLFKKENEKLLNENKNFSYIINETISEISKIKNEIKKYKKEKEIIIEERNKYINKINELKNIINDYNKNFNINNFIHYEGDEDKDFNKKDNLDNSFKNDNNYINMEDIWNIYINEKKDLDNNIKNEKNLEIYDEKNIENKDDGKISVDEIKFFIPLSDIQNNISEKELYTIKLKNNDKSLSINKKIIPQNYFNNTINFSCLKYKFYLIKISKYNSSLNNFLKEKKKNSN